MYVLPVVPRCSTQKSLSVYVHSFESTPETRRRRRQKSFEPGANVMISKIVSSKKEERQLAMLTQITTVIAEKGDHT
jgi:predicted esterase YcpF (UPF0227 family)